MTHTLSQDFFSRIWSLVKIRDYFWESWDGNRFSQEPFFKLSGIPLSKMEFFLVESSLFPASTSFFRLSRESREWNFSHFGVPDSWYWLILSRLYRWFRNGNWFSRKPFLNFRESSFPGMGLFSFSRIPDSGHIPGLFRLSRESRDGNRFSRESFFLLSGIPLPGNGIFLLVENSRFPALTYFIPIIPGR